MSEFFDDFFENPGLAGSAEVTGALRRMTDGNFVRCRAIGHSVCGRDITALEIGSMYRPVVLVGGTHGMEWASTMIALKLAWETVASFQKKTTVHGMNLKEMLARQGVVFVPLLNPDGYELRRMGRAAAPERAGLLRRFPDSDFRFWQANANGVDLNHNFNAGFYKAAKMVAKVGIHGPAPTRYGGLFPFSEPETRAVRRLCAYVRPRALYSLHSQGEEIYWRYGTDVPDGSEYIANLLSTLTGYTLCQPDTLASHAGLKDWFIQKYNRPGFTIELGLGQNPLPYEDFGDIWKRVERALFVSLIV
jgi:g-D-glutamyl-meso-diaminopimelate peptidase